MTTEDTNFKSGDVEETVAEQQHVSENTSTSAPPEAITSTGTQAGGHTGGSELQPAEETPPTHIPVAANEQEVAGESAAFPFTEALPLVEESVARSFIDFIEEFRQAEEVHISSPQLESTAEEQQASSIEQEVVNTPAGTSVNVPGEQNPPEIVPAAPDTRPVSPLLRPASRQRLPRHVNARQREEQSARETDQAVSTPAPEEPPAQEQPRPARRYRFDRPAAQAAPGPVPMQSRSEEGKERAVRGLAPTPSPAHKNGGSSASEKTKEENGQSKKSSATALPPEGPSKQSVTSEPQTANENSTATEVPAVGSHDRQRRHGQDRQREKEQAAPAPAASPVAEVVVVIPELNAPQTTEVPVEDLPPLEYSELQRASSRRRRRRRSGDVAPAVQAPTPPTAGSTTRPETPTTPTTPAQPSTTAVSRSVAQPPAVAPAAGPYNIVSGYTVGQMNQGNDTKGPFMSPDPSPARGSMPARGSLRAVRPEAQRTSIYPVRTGDVGLNQFANAVVQAIQAQTDRMVSELRRAGQAPANVAVSLPAFPSTERVGVFVDVANLLYSARTLRITIDFGKLLDFLRGNRRLVRAQAYCPTSPQSGEEQMFLQAVKGLGYRITTKNYKTFSSGAKKADLDLDLCMDVVRLVEGKAVDSIVLVSGDSDFMPMLDYCSDHGVRVEVAAFDEAMSATLRQSCDLFINLAMLDEIRA